MRDLGRRARHEARQATADLRVLPDFLLIGAQKAGTTSLYAYLSAHPDVLPAGRKEVHYFDLNFGRGPRWYRSMFPRRGAKAPSGRVVGRGAVTGEASPYYLFHPLAAERAAALVPDARLLVLLRDPVDRAWSHYRHEVAAGRETLGFAAALDAEPERLAGAEEALRNGAVEVSAAHRYFSYLSRGDYERQLAPWLKAFGREQLLVLRAEDMFSAPESQWRAAVEFLGLDPGPAPAFDVHNPGHADGMDPALRARLRDHFREPAERLERLLGTDFHWGAEEL